MKKTFFTLLLIAFVSFNINAQKTSGEVVYKMEMLGSTVHDAMTVIFDGDKSMSTMNMMGMEFTYKTNKTDVISYMNMFGKKVKVIYPTSDIAKQTENEMPEADLIETNETKKIAGYECKKYIVKMDMQQLLEEELKKQSDGIDDEELEAKIEEAKADSLFQAIMGDMSIVFYTTDKIELKLPSAYYQSMTQDMNIDFTKLGFIMGMEMDMAFMKMNFEATNFKKRKVKPSEFDFDETGYEEMTAEEFENMDSKF